MMRGGIRERRQPLHLPVKTRPVLPTCWSVNISHGGMGLAFSSSTELVRLGEGTEIELEFRLPESENVICAAGVVAWMHHVADFRSGEELSSLGVRFLALRPDARVQVAKYLAEPRFHVAVCGVLERQQATIVEALEPYARIHYVKKPAALLRLLMRGDIGVVVVVGDAEQAAVFVRNAFECRNIQGMKVLNDLLPRVIYCAEGSPAQVLALFSAGRLFRALETPLEPSDLTAAVLAAIRDYGLRTEQRWTAFAIQQALEQYDPQASDEGGTLGGGRFIIKSSGMKQVMELVRVVSPHKVSVLLQGETGVGKDVLAQQIHALSDRREEPFVVQDCGALSETLLESELFGHVRGAFTSAFSNHPGLFILADNGTVFLDEIENMSPAMQSKLLRVLETGEIRPVGGVQTRRVNIRLIVASNRNLERLVRASRFRADLYYRLNTFPIDVPPLRERVEDILPLAEYFRQQANASLKRAVPGWTQEAQAWLIRNPWRGNIRELRNVVERAVLLAAPGQQIDTGLLPELKAPLNSCTEQGGLRQRLIRIEQQLIEEALERHQGVVRRAARELRMNPVTLGRRIRKIRAQDA